MQGGNRLAGNIVERAVGYALQKLEDVVERIPKLDLQLGFEREDEGIPAKTFGDFLTYHNGRRVVIDVTLTSKLTKDDKGLDKAEAKKRKEYIKNRRPAGDGFVAMALDCAGGWGPAMMKYFREASSEYGKRYIRRMKKIKTDAIY